MCNVLQKKSKQFACRSLWVQIPPNSVRFYIWYLSLASGYQDQHIRDLSWLDLNKSWNKYVNTLCNHWLSIFAVYILCYFSFASFTDVVIPLCANRYRFCYHPLCKSTLMLFPFMQMANSRVMKLHGTWTKLGMFISFFRHFF